jgi:WD40 repeat protein
LNPRLKVLEGPEGFNTVRSLAYSPESQTLAVARADDIQLLETTLGTVLQRLEGQKYVDALAFSPDSKRLAAADKTRVQLWSLESGVAEQIPTRYSNAIPTAHSEQIRALMFSPDGKTLASESEDASIKLWTTSPSRWWFMDGLLRGSSQDAIGIAFSPDCKMLWSILKSQTTGICEVSTWEVKTSKEIQMTLTEEIPGHSVISRVGLSPQVETAAIAFTSTYSILLWDVKAKQPSHTLFGHKRIILALAFSPDAKILASASMDETVKIWCVESGSLLGTLDHPEVSRVLVFSPDGNTLATRSGNDIWLWDLSL